MTILWCENHHAISEDKWIILGHVVGVCPCGHRYTLESIVSKYVGDIHNELEEKFHKYQFAYTVQCQACGRMMDSIFMVCDDKVDPENNWDRAKEEGVMPSGFHQN